MSCFRNGTHNAPPLYGRYRIGSPQKNKSSLELQNDDAIKPTAKASYNNQMLGALKGKFCEWAPSWALPVLFARWYDNKCMQASWTLSIGVVLTVHEWIQTSTRTAIRGLLRCGTHMRPDCKLDSAWRWTLGSRMFVKTIPVLLFDFGYAVSRPNQQTPSILIWSRQSETRIKGQNWNHSITLRRCKLRVTRCYKSSRRLRFSAGYHLQSSPKVRPILYWYI